MEPGESTVSVQQPREAAEAAEVPDAAEVLEAAEVPDAAEVLEAADAAEVLEAAEVPDAADAAEAAEVPEAAEVLEAAEVADAAEAAEVPEAIDAAEIPEAETPREVAESGATSGVDCEWTPVMADPKMDATFQRHVKAVCDSADVATVVAERARLRFKRCGGTRVIVHPLFTPTVVHGTTTGWTAPTVVTDWHAEPKPVTNMRHAARALAAAIRARATVP